MSKSNPMSAIFMEDSLEGMIFDFSFFLPIFYLEFLLYLIILDITMKFEQAHCPMTVAEDDVDAGIEEGTTLVEDKLKNPCLDYVKYVPTQTFQPFLNLFFSFFGALTLFRHIIFCTPNATFETKSKTFTCAADVESAFFGGTILHFIIIEKN